jgi:hypothetical protein
LTFLVAGIVAGIDLLPMAPARGHGLAEEGDMYELLFRRAKCKCLEV